MIKENTQKAPATLGDVLYAKSKPPIPEHDWVELVRLIAAGDPLALHALYERAYRPVFTFIMRMTARLQTAEELTIDVFHDVWRYASRYDAADNTVLCWIMNLARSRAVDRLRSGGARKHGGEKPPAEPAADPHDALELRRQSESLVKALPVLTPDERRAIETTFFGEYTHAEAAVRLNRPFGAIKARIRSALHKLRNALAAEQEAGGAFPKNRCKRSEVTCAYVACALVPSEAIAAEAHIAVCPDCRLELESLRPVVDYFVCWPTNVLRPPRPLQASLARRIAEETGEKPVLPLARLWSDPEWEQVAPGIECKLLATDTERHRVSMLVCLAPGASYPAHTHAGPEELHLLDGELWIDGRKLLPGAYNYGEPGGSDHSVWSETGCSCVLVTSTRDVLRPA